MVFVFDIDDTLCETDSYSEFYIKQFLNIGWQPYVYVVKSFCFIILGKSLKNMGKSTEKCVLLTIFDIF